MIELPYTGDTVNDSDVENNSHVVNDSHIVNDNNNNDMVNDLSYNNMPLDNAENGIGILGFTESDNTSNTSSINTGYSNHICDHETIEMSFSNKKRPFTINQKVKQQIRMLEDEIESRRLERNKVSCFYSGRRMFLYCLFFIFFFNVVLIADVIIFYTYQNEICVLFNSSLPICNTPQATVSVENNTSNHYNSTTIVSGRDGRDGSDGSDGSDGQDGQAGRDGEDGQDGQAGRDGEDGQDGRDGKSCNCTLNVTHVIEIVNQVLSETTLNFKEIITEKLTTNTIVAISHGNFTNLYSTHYVGDTFNQCVQGSC